MLVAARRRSRRDDGSGALTVFMARMVFMALVSGIVEFACSPDTPAQGGTLEDKVQPLFSSWLGDFKKNIKEPIEPRIVPIEDESVQKVFPDYHFYGVYIPRMPRAPRTTGGISLENVVGVRDGESVQPISSEAALRTFLGRTLASIGSESQARAAAIASLRLAAAVAERGPYQLEEPDVSVLRKEGNIVINAIGAVRAPARGEITIRMEFNAGGTITPDAIEIDGHPRPGPPS